MSGIFLNIYFRRKYYIFGNRCIRFPGMLIHRRYDFPIRNYQYIHDDLLFAKVHFFHLVFYPYTILLQTGALEGQYFRKTGVLTPLSAQCLIDCTGDYGNLGCGGGSAALSFQFVVDHKGLEPEANYSYEGRNRDCPYNASGDDEDEAIDASFVYVGVADEAAMRLAVATVGPLSAAIDGSHDTFRFYSEGGLKGLRWVGRTFFFFFFLLRVVLKKVDCDGYTRVYEINCSIDSIEQLIYIFSRRGEEGSIASTC